MKKKWRAWRKRFVREWVGASDDEKGPGLKDNYFGRGKDND